MGYDNSEAAARDVARIRRRDQDFRSALFLDKEKDMRFHLDMLRGEATSAERSNKNDPTLSAYIREAVNTYRMANADMMAWEQGKARKDEAEQKRHPHPNRNRDRIITVPVPDRGGTVGSWFDVDVHDKLLSAVTLLAMVVLYYIISYWQVCLCIAAIMFYLFFVVSDNDRTRYLAYLAAFVGCDAMIALGFYVASHYVDTGTFWYNYGVFVVVPNILAIVAIVAREMMAKSKAQAAKS